MLFTCIAPSFRQRGDVSGERSKRQVESRELLLSSAQPATSEFVPGGPAAALHGAAGMGCSRPFQPLYSPGHPGDCRCPSARVPRSRGLPIPRVGLQAGARLELASVAFQLAASASPDLPGIPSGGHHRCPRALHLCPARGHSTGGDCQWHGSVHAPERYGPRRLKARPGVVRRRRWGRQSPTRVCAVPAGRPASAQDAAEGPANPLPAV
mmetsp:Transcript_64952/g.155094  ORF Transcript_64952/g.155094 Transcript_64952/m.155094 type:complete len:210 (-) Transcript_64952:357-986(-)